MYVYIYVCIYICTPLNVPIIRVLPENAGLYKGPIQLMVRTYFHKVGGPSVPIT